MEDDGHGPDHGCTYQACGNPDAPGACPFIRSKTSPTDRTDLVWDYEGIRKLNEAEALRHWRRTLATGLLESREILIATLIVQMQALSSESCFLIDCPASRTDERIYCRKHCAEFARAKVSDDLIEEIASMYIAGLHTTQQVADHFHVSSRAVQRFARQAGALRTAKESWLLSRSNGHWDYRRLPPEVKKVRKQVGVRRRYALLNAHPYCTLCGNRASAIRRLEVDHIDKDPSNSHPANLQVLCDQCNIGKGG